MNLALQQAAAKLKDEPVMAGAIIIAAAFTAFGLDLNVDTVDNVLMGALPIVSGLISRYQVRPAHNSVTISK